MRVKLLAITAIIGGVFVPLGWFTLPVRVAMLVALTIAFIHRYGRTPTALPLFKRGSERGWIRYTIPVAAAAAAAALLLWSSGTTDPIRSPWSVVPIPFFFLYAISVVSGQWSVVGTSIGLLLSSFVAILVYPLGFGFDHFIHAAAEHIIATTGTLSPPPLFYSAHYGLTVLLADLLPGIGVDLADRLLAPLLTVALLVPLAYRALRTTLSERAARWGLSSFLIVPFLPLAVSTPQATANVFELATVLLLVVMRSPAPTVSSPHNGRGWVAPFATAIAALLSQPMTGIIAIAIVAMMFAWRRGWRAMSAIIAALGVVGIPLAFAIAGRIVPNLDLHVALDPLPAIQRIGYALGDALTFTAADFSTADALAVARILIPVLWIVLAAIGSYVLTLRPSPTRSPSQRNGEKEGVGIRAMAILIAWAPLIALAAAALVAAAVTVPTQLTEEQTQFPLRLVQLAALLATPLAAIGLGAMFDRLRGRLPQLAGAAAIGVAATFTLLLAYPRDDAQARSGLWSVSADDIAAVHAIANDAGDTSYVVLANQMLGAAAIREFGFKPSHRVCDVTTEYTNGSESTNACKEILAFPLPAGGPIARKYWEYVSQDPSTCFSPSRGEASSSGPLARRGEREGEGGACLSRDSIDAAMSLVNVNRAYVVLHDYWRNAERLATATAAIADAEIGQFPHLRIFRLTR